MAKITGLGGAFLRARDPEALYAWYEHHLGLKRDQGCFQLPAQEHLGPVVVSFFSQASAYFPVQQPVMLNFQVDALDPLLDALAAAGVEVDAKRERSDFGDFGWFTDPEGNRVELWQPKGE
ncbi:VOC family protein [Silvibacterium sp.]|uniref:VOC family protein n=1 Tax=Silvibacterium sp. TaxID=1964179 RepID=UPI0039E640F7